MSHKLFQTQPYVHSQALDGTHHKSVKIKLVLGFQLGGEVVSIGEVGADNGEITMYHPMRGLQSLELVKEIISEDKIKNRSESCFEPSYVDFIEGLNFVSVNKNLCDVL